MAKRRKLDAEKKAKNSELKKKIGERFKKFRKAISKPQHLLAKELDVFQSTITNFELGKTYPSIGYLFHFHTKYGLNIHWLLTGQGYKFIHDLPKFSTIMESGTMYGGTKYNEYMDLLKLMQVPEIEQIIFGKLTELKALYKDKIKEFDFEDFDLEEKDQKEKE